MEERAAELAAMTTASEAIAPLSDAAQKRVVRWLADIFGVEPDVVPSAAPMTPVATPAPVATAAIRSRRRKRPAGKANGGSASPANKPKAAPGYDKQLNLHPSGKQSLKDFVAEKQPSDNFLEHNVAAAYWLSNVAEAGPVTADQIFTCYRGMSWKLPGDLRNSLQKTAYMKGWLDTSDTDDIKVTPQGLNFVELELPRPPKK
jgi:hypothetical protein